MKQLQIIAFAVVWITATACDPGMTIRQRAGVAHTTQEAGHEGAIDIRVETMRPFTGETWYVPEITFTNRESVGLTVTRAELLGPSGLMPSAGGELNHLPETIPPRQSRRLLPYFDLKQTVDKEFAGTVELRLYYTDGKMDRTSVIMLEGAPLT